MVDEAREGDALDQQRRAVADRRQGDDRRCLGHVVAVEHPDVPLHLAAGEAAHLDLADVELLAFDQCRDRRAAAARCEAPAVIAALDFLAVEAAVMQRDAPVRADVEQAEDLAVLRTAEQQGLAEQHLRHHAAARQVAAGHGEVPNAAQEGVTGRCRCRVVHRSLIARRGRRCTRRRGRTRQSSAAWAALDAVAA